MRFSEIKQFTGAGGYEVNIPLTHLERVIEEYKKDGLDLLPDFQRGHVWTEAQQIAFVEYFFRGGKSGRVIYFNKPSWNVQASTPYDDFVIVDGLQRITALMKFTKNELPVFGFLMNEFEDNPERLRSGHNLRVNINDLQTKADVLNWYIEMNSGGTVHSDEEIIRVKAMKEKELKK